MNKHVQLSGMHTVICRRQRCDKLTKCLQTTGIINWVLKPLEVQKQTRLRIHNTSAIPTPLYGSKTWTLKEQDKSRITAADDFFW